jgi:hypothetical protein
MIKIYPGPLSMNLVWITTRRMAQKINHRWITCNENFTIKTFRKKTNKIWAFLHWNLKNVFRKFSTITNVAFLILDILEGFPEFSIQWSRSLESVGTSSLNWFWVQISKSKHSWLENIIWVRIPKNIHYEDFFFHRKFKKTLNISKSKAI